MAVKCPDCGEMLHLKSTLIGTLADCWKCKKRYGLDLFSGLLTFITYFDDEGNAVKK